MDNLTFQKKWQDDDVIELFICGKSKYAEVCQSCYVGEEILSQYSNKLVNYSKNSSQTCYLEFGKKKGPYTPAFSMELLPADLYGHVLIDLDMEVKDNSERKHRCAFYVESDLGSIERFGNMMHKLVYGDIGCKVSLNDSEEILMY